MATCIETLALVGSRKADGSVNAGGRVFLTVPGSASVAVTAWQDRDKSAAITLSNGGVLLDAAGKRAIFIDEPASVRVEDSTGAAVATFTAEVATNAGLVEVRNVAFTGIDPVSGQYVAGGRTYLDAILSALYASFGGIDGMLKVTGTTTAIGLAKHIATFGLTPQMFGAKGDDSADDTAAFNALAAAARVVVGVGLAGLVPGGLPIYIPPGTYRISSAITFGSALVPPRIWGAGPNLSIIKQTNLTLGGLVITSASIPGSISGVGITATGASSGTGLTAYNLFTVFNCYIATGFATGMAGNGAAAIGSYIIGATTAATNTTLVNCFTSGAIPGTTNFGATSYSSLTENLANGGTTTGFASTTGLADVNVWRIRGTSAGAGNVAATFVTPSGLTKSTVLFMECYNNSGGAFTFTLNAQYKTSAAVAPANGSRITITFIGDPTDNVWVEAGRATTT